MIARRRSEFPIETPKPLASTSSETTVSEVFSERQLDLLGWFRRVCDAAISVSGATDSSLRRAVSRQARSAVSRQDAKASLPSSLHGWINRMAVASHSIIDDDVEYLRRAGWSEEEIYELSVVTALSVSSVEIERGMAALEEAYG